MNFLVTALVILLKLDVEFPVGGGQPEQIVLRFVHFIFGFAWIGLIYFFNFAGYRAMNELEGETRVRIIPPMMSRAMLLMRISAVVTWLAGFRYFMIYLQTDAAAIGTPSAGMKWLGEWFVCWAIAGVLIVGVTQMSMGPLKNGWLVAAIMIAILVAASWVNLAMLSIPGMSNRSLSISLGGGMGTILLMLVWGAAWRFQKKIIHWAKGQSHGGHGAVVPEEIQKFQRGSFVAMRAGMWISFPLLFFMAASSHYPFLSGI